MYDNYKITCMFNKLSVETPVGCSKCLCESDKDMLLPLRSCILNVLNQSVNPILKTGALEDLSGCVDLCTNH
jgi:hypothetical protein